MRGLRRTLTCANPKRRIKTMPTTDTPTPPAIEGQTCEELAPRICSSCVDGTQTAEGHTFPCPICRPREALDWAQKLFEANMMRQIPINLRPAWAQ